MRENGKSSTPSDRGRGRSSRGRTLGTSLEAERQHKVRAESAPPDSQRASALSWVGRVACLLLVSAFAWFRGGVDFWSQVWIGGLVMVGLVVWAIESLVDRKTPPRGLPLVALPVILGIFLGLVQLIPLPDAMAVWIAPRQHELIDSFASPAGIADSPPTPTTHISLDVTTGRAQLSMLCFALGGLVLGAHFFRLSSHVCGFFTVLAVSSAGVSIAGILQRVSFSGTTLFPNDTVSGVLPFAFFVNRNNAAGYLLIGLAAAIGLLYWNLFQVTSGRKPKPIISREIPVWRQIRQSIGIFIAELTPTRVACLLLVAINALGVVATLSRGGVIAMLIGAVLTTMMFGMARDSETRIGWAAVALVGVIGLALWLGFGTQLASRFDELNNPNSLQMSDRVRHWSDTIPAAIDFGFLGSGLGSYHAVHRLYRQDLEERMFEHADNQYFETLIESGWLGFGLLLVAIALVFGSVIFFSKKGNSVRTMAIGVAGMFLITSTVVASVTDFGVKTPANTMALALFVGIVTQHAHAFAARQNKKYLQRHELPMYLSRIVGIAVLIGVGISTWHINALARMERLGAVRPLREDYLALNERQTDGQIEELEPLVAATPTYWGYRRLGELYLHRYRLARFAELVERLPASPASLWQSTNLVSLHEQMCRFRRIDDQRVVESVAAAPEAKRDIVPAWRRLISSRNLLPFQSDVQLMLGQIQAVFGDVDKSLICLDRSARCAPTNADFAFAIGLMHIHADRIDDASAHWRNCITLQPRYFEKVMERIHTPNSERWRIEPKVVFETIIPDDPKLLLAFCGHLGGEKHASLRQKCYERADRLLSETGSISSDPAIVALEIQAKMGLGQKQAALDKIKWLIRLSPNNMRLVDLRFEMAKLMYDMDLISEAYEEIKWLRKNDFAHVKRYSGLYEKLRVRLGKQPEEL